MCVHGEQEQVVSSVTPWNKDAEQDAAVGNPLEEAAEGTAVC